MPAMSWSTSLAIASRAASSAESEEPCTSSSRAFSTDSVICERACSDASCQPWASSTLRWYCWVPSSDSRSASAREVLNGSSDGRVISRFDAIFCCVRVSRSETRLRSPSTLRWTMPVVMRVLTVPRSACPRRDERLRSSRSPSESHPSGPVDEDVEHLVHRRHGARGRLVGALEAHEAAHLLVERHAGDALAPIGHRIGERLRVGLLAAGLAHLGADAG